MHSSANPLSRSWAATLLALVVGSVGVGLVAQGCGGDSASASTGGGQDAAVEASPDASDQEAEAPQEAAATCPTGQTMCGSTCTNTAYDPGNCGACGHTCGSGQVCSSGTCSSTCGALTTCTSDGGAPFCANTQTDNANCGTCGHTCGSGQVCKGGTCALTCGALTICTPDGGTPYCANTQTDNANCGTCGQTCGSGQVCKGGACALTCGALTTCTPDGGTPYCANTQTDNANCGTCGNVCAGTSKCLAGTCSSVVVASCAAMKAALGAAAVDGEYVLYLDGDVNKPVAIWCAGMASTPAEYLTLPNQTKANFSTDYNLVTTQYLRVRIDLTKLTIDPNDETFATSTGSDPNAGNPLHSVDFGSAYSCQGSPSLLGTANIDLTGTPFAVAPNQFGIAGAGATGNVAYSSNNQVVNLQGEGFCGWAAPNGSYNPYNAGGAGSITVVYP